MNQSDLENKKKIGFMQVCLKRHGGIIHRQYIQDALKERFDLEVIDVESKYFKQFRYLKLPESLIRLWFLKREKDLWIRGFYSIVVLRPKKTKGKNIALIHHLDFSGFPLIGQPFLNLLKDVFFFRNLKKTDAIVTISEYWKNYFLKKGYPNVYRVFNGFDIEKFNISNQEVQDFKKQHGLLGKPIIYLGNCQKGKGVVEAYNALKDLNAYLVTSGERRVKIKALNLNLSYKDYLKLLKASAVVLTMSKFKEGWCRTAHEAMLLKAPVIGSGSGGMKELLTSGGQIICNDFSKLKEEVNYLLNNLEARIKIGQKGFDFAKNFTLVNLKKSWFKVMDKILC